MQAFVQKLIKIGKKNCLQRCEIPKDILIENPKDFKWSAENGLLTPSLKMSRLHVRKRYEEKILQILKNKETESDSSADDHNESKSDGIISTDVEFQTPEKILFSFMCKVMGVKKHDVDLDKTLEENGVDSMQVG